MRYLIDGYNLLHALGLLHGRSGPHALENARLALLARLHTRAGDESIAITVVFDAAGARPHGRGEEHYRGIHIYYSRDGSADDTIETLIESETAPNQLTVVSDDHRIQHAARRHRCLVRGCLDYWEEQEERPPNNPASTEMPLKPEGVSEEERQRWLREFAELDEDPRWREVLGSDFDDENMQG